MWTRRHWLLAAPSPLGLGARETWNADWDRAVLTSALAAADARFDPAAGLLTVQLGPEYRYHTALRDRTAHPTRDSLDYALLLLEHGGDKRRARALAVLDRVLAAQNTDPASPWYGIWGWYLEEPPETMAPADWNWADFLGALLILIEHRHGPALPAELRARLRRGIFHAAHAVKRRNVAMSYTNIAVKGTFVTKAASEILGDRQLAAYADERVLRLAREVDQTGSFAEYNSPTYALVSIVNFTRFAMVVKDAEARTRMQRLHDRMWLHLARYWHGPTQQFAGPMSRCYETELRAPVWLQKALGGRLSFVTKEDLLSGRARAAGETAYLALHCPDPAAGLFLNPLRARQQRELFLIAPRPGIRPVQGTTWLEPRFCLGSANRSSFWVQRRPLLAFWGAAGAPRWLQLRVLKDDYDFASAAFYSVQERHRILGCVNFFTPGGDRHPSLDPVRDGRFQASRLYLQFLMKAPVQVRGESARRVLLDAGGLPIAIEFVASGFSGEQPALTLRRHGERFGVELDLISAPRLIRWSEIREAYAVFTLALGEEPGAACEVATAPGTVTARWAGLQLRAGTTPKAWSELDADFQETIQGHPVPIVRLSDEPLA